MSYYNQVENIDELSIMPVVVALFTNQLLCPDRIINNIRTDQP
jgi:hypothetical protein